MLATEKEQSQAARLLGQRALDIIGRIPDQQLRGAVDQAIYLCENSLGNLDTLEFAQHELSLGNVQDLVVWERVAPDLRDAMTQVRNTVDKLRELFPAAANDDSPHDSEGNGDVDDAFADWTEDSLATSQQDETQEAVSKALHLGNTIAVLASMLEQEFLTFGNRIRQPNVAANRWTLLGELEEFRTKCAKFMEAVLASLINAFSPEDLNEILPRYRSAGEQAAVLRGAIVDFSREVDVFNAAISGCTKEEVPSLTGSLRELVEAFARKPAYRLVRAQDKQQIVRFRIFLRELEHEHPVSVRERVEDFARFLNLMRGINRRAELMDSDKVNLEAAKEMLMSEVPGQALVNLLKLVYGRDPELDLWVRSNRDAPPTFITDEIRSSLLPLIEGCLIQLNPFGAFG